MFNWFPEASMMGSTVSELMRRLFSLQMSSDTMFTLHPESGIAISVIEPSLLKLCETVPRTLWTWVPLAFNALMLLMDSRTLTLLADPRPGPAPLTNLALFPSLLLGGVSGADSSEVDGSSGGTSTLDRLAVSLFLLLLFFLFSFSWLGSSALSLSVSLCLSALLALNLQVSDLWPYLSQYRHLPQQSLVKWVSRLHLVQWRV